MLCGYCGTVLVLTVRAMEASQRSHISCCRHVNLHAVFSPRVPTSTGFPEVILAQHLFHLKYGDLIPHKVADLFVCFCSWTMFYRLSVTGRTLQFTSVAWLTGALAPVLYWRWVFTSWLALRKDSQQPLLHYFVLHSNCAF